MVFKVMGLNETINGVSIKEEVLEAVQVQSRESIALAKQTKVELLNEVLEESGEWFPGCQMIQVFQERGSKQLWQLSNEAKKCRKIKTENWTSNIATWR